MVKGVDLRSSGRRTAWVRTPLRAFTTVRVWIPGRLLFIPYNVLLSVTITITDLDPENFK